MGKMGQNNFRNIFGTLWPPHSHYLMGSHHWTRSYSTTMVLVWDHSGLREKLLAVIYCQSFGKYLKTKSTFFSFFASAKHRSSLC